MAFDYGPDEGRADRIERLVNEVIVRKHPEIAFLPHQEELRRLLGEMHPDARQIFIDDLQGGADVLPGAPSRLHPVIDRLFGEFVGEPDLAQEPDTLTHDLQQFGSGAGTVPPEGNGK